MQLRYAPERREAERRSCCRNGFDRRRRVRRDALVRRNLPMAHRLAARFAHRGVPRDDLIQVASMGLLHAAERFDPSQGRPFEAYAIPTIVGELKRYFRDRTWDLRVPRGVKQLHVGLNTVVDRLDQELGRSPTIAEVAAATGIAEGQVLEAIEAGAAHSIRSLSVPSDDGGAEGLERLFGQRDPALASADDRIFVDELLESLPARQRLIVRLMYWDGLSQGDIAQRLGISQMHVSRLLRRSLATLRATLGVNA